MSKYLLVPIILFLGACTTTPKPEIPDRADDGTPIQGTVVHVQSKLGMLRSADQLGFEEKPFNPCQYGLKGDAQCNKQFLTVVHFQLLCRDSEGTVSTVPVHLEPLNASRVSWKLAGQSGFTQTDMRGYGQLLLVNARPARGQRLILQIGKQYMGFTASEVTKIVLPRNFCG